jgi:hypothetical protein
MPQISTKIFNEGVNVSPGSLTGLNTPFNAPFPESLLYRRYPKSTKKRILTVLTGFYGGLTRPKTKKVLNAQKSKKDQPRFLRFFNFSRECTRRYAKKRGE